MQHGATGAITAVGPSSLRNLLRRSSATRCASTPLRMICGRMKMISSVR